MICKSNKANPVQLRIERFGQLVRTAAADFMPMTVDEKRRVARGLLEAGPAAYGAVLSHERRRRRVELVVLLELKAPLEERSREVLARIQQASGLSRFDPGGQDGKLKLRASSLAASAQRIRFVIKELVQELQALLADDRLLDLLKTA